MATIHIIYESRYGQTQKIAERMASLARRQGHTVHVSLVGAVDSRRMAEANAWVVLAPVFYGRHPQATRDFIVRHGDLLNTRPSAFVSVSGAAGSARAEDREGARHRAVELLSTTTWNPNLIATAGGAVDYPKYGFFTRLMMKAISMREGRPTDTAQCHELTDWDAVERLTRDFLAFVEPRPASFAATPMV